MQFLTVIVKKGIQWNEELTFKIAFIKILSNDLKIQNIIMKELPKKLHSLFVAWWTQCRLHFPSKNCGRRL